MISRSARGHVDGSATREPRRREETNDADEDHRREPGRGAGGRPALVLPRLVPAGRQAPGGRRWPDRGRSAALRADVAALRAGIPRRSERAGPRRRPAGHLLRSRRERAAQPRPRPRERGRHVLRRPEPRGRSARGRDDHELRRPRDRAQRERERQQRRRSEAAAPDLGGRARDGPPRDRRVVVLGRPAEAPPDRHRPDPRRRRGHPRRAGRRLRHVERHGRARGRAPRP